MNRQPQEVFARYLRSSGRRSTPERKAVLERVLAMPGHFSAEKLRESLYASGYPVSAATIYSTLELLVDCGLAARHRFARGASECMLYERITLGQRASGHHHLVCTACGKITEMRDPELTAMIKAKRFTAFEAQYFSLNIYGICGACKRKQRRRKLNNPDK